jgi:hypothetical protein
MRRGRPRSELQDQPATDPAGLEPAVRFRRLLRRESRGHPQRELATFGLLAQLVELGPFACVAGTSTG